MELLYYTGLIPKTILPKLFSVHSRLQKSQQGLEVTNLVLWLHIHSIQPSQAMRVIKELKQRRWRLENLAQAKYAMTASTCKW